MNKSRIVARLTVTRHVGVVTIVEICDDANFSSFYRYFTQEGRRRSTKQHVRTANRNEGLQPWFAAYRMQPGLDVLAKRFEAMANIKSVKIRIIKKRAYRRLISMPAHELGGLVTIKPAHDPRLEPLVTGIPVRIPDGYTTIERKWSILTPRRKVPA